MVSVLPTNAKASLPTVIPSLRFNIAPLATVTPPAIVPSAVLLAAVNVPAETVTKPV